MTYVEIWLKLLNRPGANLPLAIDTFEKVPQTPTCPTVMLFGQEASYHFYADPSIRPALDMWDVGRVTAYDFVRWARLVFREINGEEYGTAGGRDVRRDVPRRPRHPRKAGRIG